MTKSGGAFDDMHVSVTQAFREALRAREEGAAAERRRIRRAIAPALETLRSAAQSLLDGGFNLSEQRQYEAIKAIDRATKAPKRKAAKGGMTTVAVDTVSVDMRPLDRR